MHCSHRRLEFQLAPGNTKDIAQKSLPSLCNIDYLIWHTADKELLNINRDMFIAIEPQSVPSLYLNITIELRQAGVNVV